MGFFDKIMSKFESKEKQKEKLIKNAIEKIEKKEKLPKKEGYKYKESSKIIENKYHHIVKIYFVKEDLDTDDDLIEVMKEFIRKYKDRYLAKNEDNKILDYTDEPELKTMFFSEFKIELFIEIITLAGSKKKMTIKELWKYAQEFLDNKQKEGSSKAVLIGLTKIGLVKNELNY